MLYFTIKMLERGNKSLAGYQREGNLKESSS